jgi:hypothetical protein
VLAGMLGVFAACVAAPSRVESLDSAALLARLESSPARAVVLNFWASW